MLLTRVRRESSGSLRRLPNPRTRHKEYVFMWITQQAASGLWKAREVGALKVKRAAFDEVLNRLTDYVEC